MDGLVLGGLSDNQDQARVNPHQAFGENIGRVQLEVG